MAPRTAALSSITRIQGLRAGVIGAEATIACREKQGANAHFSVLKCSGGTGPRWPMSAFYIFRLEDYPVCCDSADTIKAATSKAKAHSKEKPGKYLILNRRTGLQRVIRAGMPRSNQSRTKAVPDKTTEVVNCRASRQLAALRRERARREQKLQTANLREKGSASVSLSAN